MIRFYLKNKEIKNKTVVFDEEQSKQIRKVLRMKPGDKVITFDNKGWEFVVELEKITNDFTVGKIIEQTLTETKTNIVLYQALPRSLKVEFIIQKCTELGVDKIVFFESDFSQVKASQLSETRIKRWRKIAIESAEQCGRIFIPEIEIYTGNIKDEKEKFENCFYLNKDGEVLSKYISFTDNILELNLKSAVKTTLSGATTTESYTQELLSKIEFFVGPEGGFSKEEIAKFQGLGVRAVRIAENTLRSETAGMAFLSQVQLLKLNV